MAATAPVDLKSVRLARIRALCKSGYAHQIRIKAGVSLKEIADDVGVTESAISYWENGLRAPRTASALKYAEVLAGLSGGQF
jgi:transcriptional regulator with XRE-family HTH domain